MRYEVYDLATLKRSVAEMGSNDRLSLHFCAGIYDASQTGEIVAVRVTDIGITLHEERRHGPVVDTAQKSA